MPIYRPIAILVRGAFMALILLAATLGSLHAARAQAPGPEGGPALTPATPLQPPQPLAPPRAPGEITASADQPDQGPGAMRTLTVYGNGEASAPPDIVFIDTGVVTQAANAGDALGANTKAMRGLFDGLDKMGVAKQDVQTTQFSVSPVYDQTQNSDQPPAIRAYQVTNQVTVTIRKLDNVGAVLDQLVALGSNRLDSIRFAIEKPEPVLDRARQDATANARHKAELFAQAAGLTLGPVLAMSEGSASVEPPRPMMRMLAAEAQPVPVASGQQKVAASVTLVFALQ